MSILGRCKTAHSFPPPALLDGFGCSTHGQWCASVPQFLACWFRTRVNKLCRTDYTTQGNIQIQCNPCQITYGTFHRTGTKNVLICMETQKTPNSQSHLEKEKRSWRNEAPWLQTILQSYSHQNSMVLAQKQKYKSMEQDRKPRNKPMHLWSINLWQRRQEYTMEKRQSLQ